jgi:hypothetical protein
MADPVSYVVHPSDIALQDTAAYNERFNEIIYLRNLAQDESDSLRKSNIIETMHGIATEIEDFFSDDTTVADIGPLLDLWEVEGKGSFGSVAPQMQAYEDSIKLASIHSDSSGIDLSPEQNQQAIAGLDAKKKALDDIQAYSDEWSAYYDETQSKMTSLWNRYEAIKDADPDKDWWAESRFVWWGLADPDNAIQEEIAALGNEYRQLDMASKSGPLPTAIGQKLDRVKTDYTLALEALNNLKGE